MIFSLDFITLVSLIELFQHNLQDYFDSVRSYFTEDKFVFGYIFDLQKTSLYTFE